MPFQTFLISFFTGMLISYILFNKGLGFSIIGLYMRRRYKNSVCIDCDGNIYEGMWKQAHPIVVKYTKTGKKRVVRERVFLSILESKFPFKDTGVCVWTDNELKLLRYLEPVKIRLAVPVTEHAEECEIRLRKGEISGYDFSYLEARNGYISSNIFRWLALHGKPSKYIIDGELRLPKERPDVGIKDFVYCWKVRDMEGFDRAVAKLALIEEYRGIR